MNAHMRPHMLHTLQMGIYSEITRNKRDEGTSGEQRLRVDGSGGAGKKLARAGPHAALCRTVAPPLAVT